MDVEELNEYLSKLKGDLEEVQEERLFVFKQTGLHVSASTVKKYESEVENLKGRIAEVESLLRSKSAEHT
jgi:hypothetical protein